MSRTHEPGQAVFRSILPEDIDWQLKVQGSVLNRARTSFATTALPEENEAERYLRS
jgi:hypothetical protein